MKSQSPWASDADLAQRFPHPVNESVIAFLTNGYPWSAHSDLAEEFLLGVKRLAGVKTYTPDEWRYSYYMAYTEAGIIFGLAIGMAGILARLPDCDEWALSQGGKPFDQLNAGWYEFQVIFDRGLSSSKWLGRALKETGKVVP